MTILQGTMQDGTVIPVQVDAQGRLVAEGLPGSVGPQGPPGPAGGVFDLPPGAADGLVLSWRDGGLVWSTAAPPAALGMRRLEVLSVGSVPQPGGDTTGTTGPHSVIHLGTLIEQTAAYTQPARHPHYGSTEGSGSGGSTAYKVFTFTDCGLYLQANCNVRLSRVYNQGNVSFSINYAGGGSSSFTSTENEFTYPPALFSFDGAGRRVQSVTAQTNGPYQSQWYQSTLFYELPTGLLIPSLQDKVLSVSGDVTGLRVGQGVIAEGGALLGVVTNVDPAGVKVWVQGRQTVTAGPVYVAEPAAP